MVSDGSVQGVSPRATRAALIPDSRPVAAASVSVGVFFTALALLTGMIWGRPVWGTFWDWGDARMMTTAVMFFVYLGYLALRRSIDDPVQRARRSAVLGVVAFAQVPIVHFSVLWWRTLHQGPTLVRPDPTIDGRMLFALMVNLFAFTVISLFAHLPGQIGITGHKFLGSL